MPFIDEHYRKQYKPFIEKIYRTINGNSYTSGNDQLAALRNLRTHTTYVIYELLMRITGASWQKDKINSMFDAYGILSAVEANVRDFFDNVERQKLTEKWIGRKE